jgi:hypothetical protein
MIAKAATKAKLKLFKQMAAALWGPQYRSEAARQLDVHLRTLMRWDAGERPVPDEKIDMMVTLLDERQKKITTLLIEFKTSKAASAKERVAMERQLAIYREKGVK